jgi:hypothetical protein
MIMKGGPRSMVQCHGNFNTAIVIYRVGVVEDTKV